MNPKHVILALLMFASSALQPVVGQVKPGQGAAWIDSHPEIASRLADFDESSSFQSVHETNSRVDAQANVIRALYRIDAPGAELSGPPEQRARIFLASRAERFGMASSPNDLELVSLETGRYGSHATFQQTFFGLPVYNRRVKVNLNAAGMPTLVFSAYAPHLKGIRSFQTRPGLTADAVLARAQSLLGAPTVRSTAPQLVVIPERSPRLAWRLVAWPESPMVEIEFLFDARDGSLIMAQNLSTHLRGVSGFEFRVSSFADSKSQIPNSRREPTNSKQQTANSKQQTANSKQYSKLETRNSKLETRATGRGLVFDPDPLSVSGSFYGESLSDNNDADTPELNAERIEVELQDISMDNDGMYRLNGPFVRIVSESSGGTIVYDPPAEPARDGFQYPRSNDFFEAVNVYYHIDKSQRYLQSLDVGHDIQNLPISVNPHGLGLEDNSRYFPDLNYIAFGDGGVDDAEDAFVIWHEYGHALLQSSAPGLLRGSEGKALHEGWADYWATSYTRSLVEAGVIRRTDWKNLFKWDSGDGTIWTGRELTFTGKYPADTFCDEGGLQCDIYQDGVLWGSTLMDIYDVLGRSITDRLNLASHSYLMHPVTFRDAAEAIIQADIDLYAGEHVDFLIQTFNARGLIDLASFGPLAYHEPVSATEQLGGALPITVEATGISAPVEQVFFVYGYDAPASDTTHLTLDQENTYIGVLPLPASPATVNYYVLAVDQLGLMVRLPAASSGQPYFSFQVGPDLDPPTIQHVVQSDVALIDWPARLTATVNDNLGVDTVVVDFYIENSLEQRIAEGGFGLSMGSGRYSGSFPVSLDVVEPGSTVYYRLTARDRSLAGNESRFPEQGYLTFAIILENNVFRNYDFEKDLEGFIADAPWQRGAPSYGVEVAHSGNGVWATSTDAAYSSNARRSSLEIPPINLQGLDNAYLVFWHWFDIEHDGEAFPESAVETVLWDGGNVKYSQDGGANWTLLQPLDGYNGTIAAGRGNPLEGEPAFGGYSYGWRQVIAPLPLGDIRIRFDFGTDDGNDGRALSFAGWYVDDLAVLAAPPRDVESPTAARLPEAVSVRDPGQEPPEPIVELTDDTGIASVFVDYEVFTASGGRQGRFRLAMDGAQKNIYRAPFPDDIRSPLAVGDSITYRLTATDFSGNTTAYPPVSDSPFRIEYRLRDTIDLLESVQATGLWKPVGNDAWAVARDDRHEEVSSLVLGPLDLPVNVDILHLELDFQHELFPGHGGNLKISTDRAFTWNVLNPLDGYDTRFPSDDSVPPAMRDQEVFSGPRPNLRKAQFDLLGWKGKQVWLRIDFAAQSELAAQEYWRVQRASVSYSTLKTVKGGFDVPREFTLHANFPDPFTSITHLSYTLAETTPVTLDIYDVLGRRVELLVEELESAGTYTVTFDGSNLPNGLYFLRLTTDQGRAVEPLVVSR